LIGKTLLALAGALALGGVLFGGPAEAAEKAQTLTLDGGPLVQGSAPLPEFHLNLLGDSVPLGLAPPGSAPDLDIAVSSPDNGVFHFLFSPRPQFGFGYDRLTGDNRGYAGLTWSLFDDHTLFGSVGLGGSYNPGLSMLDDPARRSVGPPLMLHGALEFGYRLGEDHSISLRLDEGRAPEFRLNTETSDDFRLRYGLKF
jgi:hypothetical protein